MRKRREQVLIRRAKRGDAEAVQSLIQAHQASLYHFMLRLTGRPDAAEDMSQEAFVRVLGNLHRFDERFRFSTWLFTIARRLWINHVQKLKPTFDSDVISGVHAESPQPADCLSDEEDRGRMADAIGLGIESLTPRQQEILLLFHARGCSIQEIADRQDLPIGTVKSHLFRARQRMAVTIENSGVLQEVGP
ncbi:MAG: RNA polymerase sigma factor [Phycisphaerales bacterium]|nr:RNA polymerase sigma factor [Phycisphaerales bacterium]